MVPSPVKLEVVRSKCEEKCVTEAPAPCLTQSQIIELLVEMERRKLQTRRIRRLQLEIAEALKAGISVESGRHLVKLDSNGKVQVLPFQGCILLY